MRPLVDPHLKEIPAYVPGLSIGAMKKKFGRENFIKLASNENAFGPSPLALEAAARALRNAHRYPNELRQDLKNRICEYLGVAGVEPQNIILGNGSNEIITLLSRTFLSQDEILLNGWPSFMVYRLSAAAMNHEELTVPLDSSLDYNLEGMQTFACGPKRERIKLIFLGNPNNPTGQYLSKEKLSRFFESVPPHVIVVVDEAYFEYVDKEDYATSIEWVLRRPRTVVMRTFSKIFGLAGMRIGYAVCDPEIASILHRVRDAFNVNGIAQEAAMMALQDKAHIAQGRNNNFEQIKRVKSELEGLGLWASQSVGNFVLMRLADWMPGAAAVAEHFLEKGIIVRTVLEYDLPRYLRVTIGRPEENEAFLSGLRDISNHR